MQTKKLFLRLKILGVLVCIANHVQLLHKRKKTENDKNCLFHGKKGGVTNHYKDVEVRALNQQ